ncbi:MAG: alpha/beta hydrolase [Actinomycetota bacterium]|nr:alpha/beta hydrolase [Actinomycetota bacterium]
MGFNVKSVVLPNQVSLDYVEQGDPSASPVLLLHGFGDSWRSFERVLPHLPASIRFFALTQRGHGEASHPPTGYSINHFAEDLAAFMDAVHLRAAVIVGHSMGSAVAQRFAIDHPERTLGLVLVGASPTMAGTAAARQFWDSTVSKLKDPVDPRLVREMTESLLVKPVPQPFLDTVLKEGMKVPAHVWKGAFESRWNLEGDFSAQLGMIEAPTLIVWGEQDARYGRAEQEALASAITGARLVIYQDAGHLLHWEEPELFASDLVDFVQRLE